MTVEEEVAELRGLEYFLRDELFALTLPSALGPEQRKRRQRETRDWLVLTGKRLAAVTGTP